jgi:hypothetical protein
VGSSSSSGSWLPVTVELFKYLVQRVCGCVVFILIGRLCSSETKKRRIELWLKGGLLFYFYLCCIICNSYMFQLELAAFGP